MSSKNTSSWNAVTEYKDYQESLDRLSAIANNNQVNKAMDGYQVYQDLKTIQAYNGDDRDERLDLVLAKLSLANSGYAMLGSFANNHKHKDAGAFINTSSMQFDVALGSVALSRMFFNLSERKYDKVIVNFFVALDSSMGILQHATEKVTGRNFSKATIGTGRLLFPGVANVIESDFFQKTIITNATNQIENTVNNYNKAVDGVSRLMEKVAETAKHIKERAEKLAESTINFRDKVIKSLKEGVDKGINEARELLNKARKDMVDAYDGVKKTLKDLKEQTIDKVKNKIDEYAKQLNKALDELNKEYGKDAWEKYFKTAWQKLKDYADDLPDWLPETVKNWLNLPRIDKYHLYDPLVLDLNGNGVIDVIEADGYRGVLFDHNGDGIATATSWVTNGDGLLVLDINGDGIINSGLELFGDSTVLADGSRAKHGFFALAQFDDNKDGVIDGNDKVFNNLKVWQDKNSDGISTADELLDLSQVGIDSLSLVYSDVNEMLGNGVVVAQQSTYSQDGKDGLLADLHFNHNPLYSRYADTLELSDAQKSLPNLKGMGRLRDLRQASALSDELTTLLTEYQLANTKTAQLNLLPKIIKAWADTDPTVKNKDTDTPKVRFAKPTNQGREGGIALTPTQAKALADFSVSTEHLSQLSALSDKISVLDGISGTKTTTLFVTSEQAINDALVRINQTYQSLQTNVYHSLLTQTRLKDYLAKISLVFDDNGLLFDYDDLTKHIQAKYQDDPQNAFVDLAELLVYGGLKDWMQGKMLLAQFAKEAKDNGVLNDYLALLDSATITKLATQQGADTSDTLTATGILDTDVLFGHDGDDTLIAGLSVSMLSGGAGSDAYVYHQGFGHSIIDNDDTSHQRLDVIRLAYVNKASISYKRQGDSLVVSVAGEMGTITVKNMFYGDTFSHHIDKIIAKDGEILLSDITETLLKGTKANDTLIGFGLDDVINAGAGNDIIEGRGGADLIYAGSGNDRIDAGAGDDIIYLESGNNYAYGGDDNDVIYSGAGNDKLEGGVGSDVYVLGKNFGRDEIINFNPNQQDEDLIQFTDGILLNQLSFKRLDNHLFVNQKGTTSSVKIADFFDKDALGDFSLQKIIATDGKYITTDQIKTLVIQGTVGNDNLYAYSTGSRLDGKQGSDKLFGNIGNDLLIGGIGNDVLMGDSGNDILDGGFGNDVLNGGTGNDRLIGGLGNDVYLYKKGDGKDTIIDSNGTNDVLKIQGLTLAELDFNKQGNHLFIGVNGSDDGVIIENYFKKFVTQPLKPLVSMLKPMAYHHHILNSINGSNVIESVIVENKTLDYQDVNNFIANGTVI